MIKTWWCKAKFEQMPMSCSLHWRHNDHGGVSNHQPHGCLLNHLFRCRSKKTSKPRVTAFVRGIHRDRWIPRTKCQYHGKWFHLMTSSCVPVFLVKYVHRKYLGQSQYQYDLFKYRDSHYKNKRVVKSSYLYNGSSYTNKTSLYWDTSRQLQI